IPYLTTRADQAQRSSTWTSESPCHTTQRLDRAARRAAETLRTQPGQELTKSKMTQARIGGCLHMVCSCSEGAHLHPAAPARQAATGRTLFVWPTGPARHTHRPSASYEVPHAA